MKIARSSYPVLFAIILVALIPKTIEQFSTELYTKLFLPFIIISMILVVISLILAIKDKEVFHIATDERTKKVDRSAVYYSWWFTLFFIFVLSIIAFIQGFTVMQFTSVIFSEMFLTMIIFHMYFNFRGEEQQ